MKSVIVSVIALGSAAFLSPAHADTYQFTAAIAVPRARSTRPHHPVGAYLERSTSAFSTLRRN